MAKRIYVLNGPNLDLLGEREPALYGRQTLQDVESQCRAITDRHGLELAFRQSNAEHDLVAWLHEARRSAGIAMNPAALCYHSVSILDAMRACECPIVEVHISNLYRREEPWRRQSMLAAAATGVITGLGTAGYGLAIEHLVQLLAGVTEAG